MSQIVNLTEYAVAPLVTTGIDGRWQAIAVVKATYVWAPSGQCTLVEALPVLMAEQFAGPPASSGLLRASELSPPKPKVDVLLAGALVFPQPITAIDVELSVGGRLVKRARVFGDRAWLPGVVADLTPSQPRPVTRIPIAWERCFGGSDPVDARCIEPRNPAGSGVAKEPTILHGKPAPNFEDAQSLLPVHVGRPAPVGFGPIAAHWPQRLVLAGTYDEAWEKNRRPLPPVDFSPAYFNVAPTDQQLDDYTPGEELRLLNMTTASHDRIRLPDLHVPVTFVSSDEMCDEMATVDTVIVEPEERRMSVLARARTELNEGPMSLARIVVGELTEGMRKAIEEGKAYPWHRKRRKVA
jgi:hypothetical protein